MYCMDRSHFYCLPEALTTDWLYNSQLYPHSLFILQMELLLPTYSRLPSPVGRRRLAWLQLRLARSVSRLRTRRFLGALLQRALLIVLVASVTVALIMHVMREGRDAGDLRSTNENSPLSRINLASRLDFPFEMGCRAIDASGERANATLVMLARNSELDNVVSSMRSIERHFNQWFGYPWTFLNDVEFSALFREEVRKHTKSTVEFGTVPAEHWNFPTDIDKETFDEYIQSQGDREVLYGNMESYHKMCRFYSGHFYDHPLVQKREWYWRVEPDVQFFCDLTYDPFVEMAKHNKKYGFNVLLEELYYTVPSLFLETKAFIAANGIKLKSAWDIVVKQYQTLVDKTGFSYFTWKSNDDLRQQVQRNLILNRILKQESKTDKDLAKIQKFKKMRNVFKDAYKMPDLMVDKIHDEEYNLCHFWSNFEIARTDLFLLQTYKDYFMHLERAGGFYKERWGDAAVHSLAVAMILSKEELHYFRDIGYKHSSHGHCPNNAPGKQLPYVSGGFDDYAPELWYSTFLRGSQPDTPVKNGVGCRCKCPRRFKSIEDTSPVCVRRYAEVLSDDYTTFTVVDMEALQFQVEKEIDEYLAAGGTLGDAGQFTKSEKRMPFVRGQ